MSTESPTKTITNPKSCFLNLSYTSGDTPSPIERIITNYFRERGFEVKTGRMAPGGEKTDKGILQVIKSCSFGIVVYNEFRHNISYEWGIMDAFGMPVIPFINRNAHINIEDDFSDKEGTNFIFYSGDSCEEDIIRELENSDSLKAAIENVEKKIGESISPEETDEVKEASRILTESNIPLGGISTDKKGIKVFDSANILDAFIEIKELTPVGHFFRANAYYYAGDFGNAEKEYKEAIKINPDLAEVHYNLGVLLERLKRHGEAEKEYKEVVRINPNYMAAHYNLGNLLADLKRYDEAENEYRETIRINPDFVQAHYNIGNLLRDLKRFDKAEKEFKEAIRINPDHAEAHNNLGNLLAKSKRYDEAEKEYREAIRINPDNAEAHNNLGDLLKDLKRYKEAEKEWREAIIINPEHAEAHNNLGTLFSITERPKEAEKEYRKALRINPNYAEAHANLGILFLKTKRLKEAEEELAKAHELFLDQERYEDADKVFNELRGVWYKK